MKRLLAVILAGALLLSGCAVYWEDEAAPAERVEKTEQSSKKPNKESMREDLEEPSQEESSKEEVNEENLEEPSQEESSKEEISDDSVMSNDSKEEVNEEDLEEPSQEESSKEEISDDSAMSNDSKEEVREEELEEPSQEQPQASAKTLGELYETGWEPGAVYLYKKNAYYCIKRDKEAYIYSLALGAGNQPILLGAGTLIGQYGDALFKEEEDRISALDLSAADGIWKDLCEAGEDSILLSADDRLLILRGKESATRIQIIHLADLSIAEKELPHMVEKADFQGGMLYFSEKKGEELFLYSSDLGAGAPKELHRAAVGFDWVIFANQVLFHKSGAQPYLLNLETGAVDAFHAFELEPLFGGMNEELICPRLARFFEGVAYFEMTGGNYWAHDLAKNQGKEIKEIPDADRIPLRNGGSYSGGGSAAEHTFKVFLEGKEYTAYQNLYTHLYLQDANDSGAIVAGAGRIFACCWEEGEHFESYLIAEHPLV